MNFINSTKRTLYGLSLGHFMVDLYVAVLIPLYPYIAQRLDVNIAQISVAIAVGHSVSSLLQPVFGHISDKINHRFFMFWGLILPCIFTPLGYIAPNLWALTLCLMLGMIGNAFYHPQTTSMIKSVYKENEALTYAMGLFLGLGTIGYAFGPYISTYFLKTFGENNYVFIGAAGIIFSIFLLFFVPKIEIVQKNQTCNFINAMGKILKNKSCLYLIFITIIKALLVMSFGTYVPFLLKNHGYTLTQTGFTVTMFYILGGLSMIVSSKIENLVKLKGLIILSYAPLLPLFLLFLYLLKINKFLSAAIFIISGFFVLLAAGAILAHSQKIMPKNTGTISGIIQGFTLSIGALLLIPFGAIAQNYGVECVLILTAFIAFITALYSAKTKLV